MRRSLGTFAVVALLVPGALPQKGDDGVRELVYVTTRDGISIVGAGTGSETFHAPGGVAAGDWSRLIVAVPAHGGRTSVQALDPVDGSVADSIALDGDLRVRSVSFTGDEVVLMPRGQRGSAYQPEGRLETRIVVARFDGTPPRVIDLDGNFEAEGLSASGDGLFVLEYTPPGDPTKYRIRRLELATAELYDVYALDKDVQGNMRGQARTQVLAPDGQRLYTLYTKPNGEAFVHVLSLTDGWAHCADLPAPFGTSPRGMAIATSPDGRKLYVVDAPTGSIAEVDTDLDQIDSGPLRVVRLDEPLGSARDPVATVYSATMHVAVGQRVTTIRLPTLHKQRSTTFGQRVVALSGIGPGRPVDPSYYVAEPHRVLRVDAFSDLVFESKARIQSIHRVIVQVAVPPETAEV